MSDKYRDPQIDQLPNDALPTKPEQLPGELRNVAEIVARTIAAMRHDLVADIDMLATRAIFAVGEEYRGTSIYCHNLGKWFEQYRNGLIRDEFDRRTITGETATAVVRDMAAREWPGERRRICERTVWKILGRPDDRQMRLF